MSDHEHKHRRVEVEESTSTRDMRRALRRHVGQLLSIETTGNPGEDEIGVLIRVRKGVITILDEGVKQYIGIDKISTFNVTIGQEG